MKKITMYKTYDGKLFDNEQEAKEWEENSMREKRQYEVTIHYEGVLPYWSFVLDEEPDRKKLEGIIWEHISETPLEDPIWTWGELFGVLDMPDNSVKISYEIHEDD